MVDLVLSLLVLASVALMAGAWFLYRRTGELRNALLMVLLAVIALANVAIWIVPTADGDAPLDRIDEQR